MDRNMRIPPIPLVFQLCVENSHISLRKAVELGGSSLDTQV